MIERSQVAIQGARVGLPALLTVACLMSLTVGGCARKDNQIQPDVSSTAVDAIFVDAAQETGLDFVHFNGMTGEHYYNEMMGGGPTEVTRNPSPCSATRHSKPHTATRTSCRTAGTSSISRSAVRARSERRPNRRFA